MKSIKGWVREKAGVAGADARFADRGADSYDRSLISREIHAICARDKVFYRCIGAGVRPVGFLQQPIPHLHQIEELIMKG